MSHPVWVRGLKLPEHGATTLIPQSHPVWVRGLKLFELLYIDMLVSVAPRVGAWIETNIFFVDFVES